MQVENSLTKCWLRLVYDTASWLQFKTYTVILHSEFCIHSMIHGQATREVKEEEA